MSRDQRPALYDEGAETAVVGAMMYRPECRDVVFDQLTSSDFYVTDVRDVFGACKQLFDRGLASDVVTVEAELSGRVDRARLLQLELACPSSRNVGSYVAKVQEFAARRSLSEFGKWTAGFARSASGSAGELLEKTREEFEALQGGQATSDVFPTLQTLTAFLEDHEDVEEFSPWLLPGLIRQQGKLLIVGPEGSGKSTLLRQLAIGAAGGVHPFTLKPIEPVSTMIFDLENPPEAIREMCRPMHDKSIEVAENCHIVPQEQGIDLRNRADRVALEATIAGVRPQLVVMGPVYKMVGAVNSAEESSAMAEVMFLIDRLRVRYNVAFVLEHHTPHSDGFQHQPRPSGTSLWKRWPHMGVAMLPVETDDDSAPSSYRLTRFRGDRVQNSWPKVIVRSGSVWPWAVEEGDGEARF